MGTNYFLRKSEKRWRAAINRWLDEGGWICTEYEREWRVSPDEFWKLVEAKRTAPECMSRYRSPSGTTTCQNGIDFSPYSFS